MASKRTKSAPPHHRTKIVCNQSPRHGAKILAIAVHSTESADVKGWDDLNGVGNWFNNPKSQASSHIGIDGEANSMRWVYDSKKAWTISALNSVTLNIEFIGRAAQPEKAWEEEQIREGARWAAWWCLQYGIPAQRGACRAKNGQAWISKRGIIRHSDLTHAGIGSHTDPGKQFPMRDFLDKIQYYKKNGWVR